jgi:Transposase DDE domain
MYFKVSGRHNPATNQPGWYYRLVESYRNSDGRVCHRTMLNLGFLEGLSPEQMNEIQKILTERAENHGKSLFEASASDDIIVSQYVEEYYARLVSEKRIDVSPSKNKVSKPGKDWQTVDINSIRNKDVREVGAEWLCFQAVRQLGMDVFLSNHDWDQEQVQLAITHIISRAVYPASELKTSLWIKENSAVCELTGYDVDKITKDKLYRISQKLYQVKQEMEQHLSLRTNELFDIEDKIILYDLTNTYFEGSMRGSKLAKYGRSKEKRTDAKLVVLALVINPEGFIKYSDIFQGNISDPATLGKIIDHLRERTSTSAHKAIVVIDAGIASEANLKLIKEKGYEYICVTRSNMKNYNAVAAGGVVTVRDNKQQKIELCQVRKEGHSDYFLKIESHSKELKERSMNEQFRQRFEEGMQKIADSLAKKGGIKQADKVHERIGRLKQKFPSIGRYYDIEVEVAPKPEPEKKGKGKKSRVQTKENEVENKIVTSIKWSVKEGVDINARSGVYFLQSSIQDTEKVLWDGYNTIREIEATFRVLKTDLDLRPIYHKKDETTMAHLNLGLLAYWLVNTIRHQLKKEGINSQWSEIVRTMNTQKAVTTTAQNNQDEIIQIRRCTEPNEKVKRIYDILKYKPEPYKKKKYVVHKPDFKNAYSVDNKLIRSD